MYKKYLIIVIIFFLLFTFNCSQSVVNENEKIEKVYLNLTLNDETDVIDAWHIYFRNIKDKDLSSSINIFDISEINQICLFPGKYNIYAYGLTDKTLTSKKVFSYSNLLEYECFNNKELEIYLKELIPSIEVVKDEPAGNVYIKVKMTNLKESFSLSSLSLKQGSDRARSLEFGYSEDNIYYVAPVTLYQNGEWYLNISYLLKESKRDDDKLDEDGLNISTSYFSNIYLGEYNFIM